MQIPRGSISAEGAWRHFKSTRHNLSHMPFRSWCFSSVAGGVADDPYRNAGGYTGPPRLERDVMFLTSRGHLGFTQCELYMVNRESQAMAGAASMKPATEILVTLVPKEVHARRKQDTIVRRMTVGPPRVPWNGLLRTTKHATETDVGGRLATDLPLITWMVRHSCSRHRVGHLTKRCENIRYRGEKSFGHGFQERSCCVASSK